MCLIFTYNPVSEHFHGPILNIILAVRRLTQPYLMVSSISERERERGEDREREREKQRDKGREARTARERQGEGGA